MRKKATIFALISVLITALAACTSNEKKSVFDMIRESPAANFSCLTVQRRLWIVRSHHFILLQIWIYKNPPWNLQIQKKTGYIGSSLIHPKR